MRFAESPAHALDSRGATRELCPRRSRASSSSRRSLPRRRIRRRAQSRRSWPLWLLAFALTLIALWVAYFFRDPQRTGERGERLVISPADGKVVMITRGRRADVHEGARDAHFDFHERLQRARESISGERDRAFRRATSRALSQCGGGRIGSLENEQTSVGLEAGLEPHSRATDRRIDRAAYRHRREGRRSRAAR